MWRSLSIAKKIYISIALIVVGYSLSMVYIYIEGHTAKERLTRVSTTLFPASLQSRSALNAFQEQIRAYEDAVTIGEPKLLNVGLEKQEAALSSLGEVTSNISLAEDDKKSVHDVISQLKNYTVQAQATYALMATGKTVPKERAAKLVTQAGDLETRLKSLSRYFSQQLQNEILSINRNAIRTQIITGFTFILVVVPSLAVLAIVLTNIVRRINATANRMHYISSGAGSLDERIYIAQGGKFSGQHPVSLPGVDEISTLANSFDKMATELQKSFRNQEGLYQELRKRNEELTESRERFRTIFDSVNDAVFIHDSETGAILDVNQTMLDIYGYSREEVSRIDVGDLSSGEPPYTQADAVTWIMKASAGEPQSFEWHCRHKDCHLFWAEVNMRLSTIGDVDRVLVTVRDITDRKRLMQQLHDAQKMESIGQLAGGIAHDFNNILAAIVGYGSILQIKIRNDDPSKQYVNQILASAESAAGLTQSLLAFSRKQVINPKNIDLKESIRKVEKFLTRIIGEDIMLTTALSAEALMIYADITQIEQVLMNLATNARDAMPKGGRLMIEAGRAMFDDEYIKMHGYGTPGPYAMLSVSDTGEGMDEQTQKQIFEPFFTTKGLGRGTGLGLAIVYGIVKQNNGYINVYSEVDKGTTFKIYFPLISSRAGEDRHPEVQQPLRGGTETILFAEDNVTVRLLNREVLQEVGYTVIEAADGEEALQKFREHGDRISLIILDVIMPKKNGREVFEEARRSNPDVKVIFTSGYPADLIQKEGVLEKGLHFISKPSPPQALLRKVREVLDQ
jgi:PAS domain S-box-containing protein